MAAPRCRSRPMGHNPLRNDDVRDTIRYAHYPGHVHLGNSTRAISPVTTASRERKTTGAENERQRRRAERAWRVRCATNAAVAFLLCDPGRVQGTGQQPIYTGLPTQGYESWRRVFGKAAANKVGHNHVLAFPPFVSRGRRRTANILPRSGRQVAAKTLHLAFGWPVDNCHIIHLRVGRWQPG